MYLGLQNQTYTNNTKPCHIIWNTNLDIPRDSRVLFILFNMALETNGIVTEGVGIVLNTKLSTSACASLSILTISSFLVYGQGRHCIQHNNDINFAQDAVFPICVRFILRILVGTPIILTAIFRLSSQSLHAIAAALPLTRPRLLPSIHFPT
jgi:hypothetical protein